MAGEDLRLEIKRLVLATLDIQDVEAEAIDDDAPLFEQGNLLGLDSIDALEIVMALQEKYGVRLDDKNQSRFILKTIGTIAEFIDRERQK